MTEGNGADTHILLFVAGRSHQSLEAIHQLESIVAQGARAAKITVVDLLETPDAALERDILAIPTLIREHPPPQVRIIGDLSDKERVMSVLRL